jgi:hypothetical protein
VISIETSGGSKATTGASSGGAGGSGKEAGAVPGGTGEAEKGGGRSGSISGTTSAGAVVGVMQTTHTQQRGGGSYPLSTLVFVGLIAFLLGSLLRSLLSPADFIYVVTDLRDAEGAAGGWREIRRLVEIKYLYGGWDLQVAVVRRP